MKELQELVKYLQWNITKDERDRYKGNKFPHYQGVIGILWLDKNSYLQLYYAVDKNHPSHDESRATDEQEKFFQRYRKAWQLMNR